MPAVKIKNSRYIILITVFNILPPKNSETSIMSLEPKGLNNLHISRQKMMAIMLIYMTLIQADEFVEDIILLDKFKKIWFIVIIIIKAIASNLPIFCNESIHYFLS